MNLLRDINHQEFKCVSDHVLSDTQLNNQFFDQSLMPLYKGHCYTMDKCLVPTCPLLRDSAVKTLL